MAKSKVAVLKVKPETILQDIERLCELAGMRDALAHGKTTILKDNISWHYPFPGANSTPWQMEGTILALKKAGYGDVTCVQNKTVVTNAFKGEDLNNYVPLFKKYDVPVLYNFKGDGHEVGRVLAQGEDARPAQDLPGGHPGPRLLLRQEHRPPPDDEVPHLHDDDGRDEERLRGPPRHEAPLHALVDPPHARGPARHPEGDPHGHLRDLRRDDGRQRPGPPHDDPGREGLHARERRPGGHRRRGGEDDGLRPDVARVHQGRARRRPRRGGHAGHRDRWRRYFERELGLPRRRQRGERHRGPHVVRADEALPEALLPHPAGQRLHLRERGLPRLLSLAAQGPAHLRDVEGRDGLGQALRGYTSAARASGSTAARRAPTARGSRRRPSSPRIPGSSPRAEARVSVGSS